MKQHITYKQWNSLSWPAKERISEWAEEHGYDNDKASLQDWLTIGRMIEFLDEQYNKLDVYWEIGRGSVWIVEADVDIRKKQRRFLGDKLRSTLWQGVKEVLEK